MGLEHINFIWYLRRVSIWALIGYVAGVGTVTGHRNHMRSTLKRAHEAELVFGSHPRKDVHAIGGVLQFQLGHPRQFGTHTSED